MECIDINEKLDHLIAKYDIYKYNLNLIQCNKAEELLRNLWDNISVDRKIAIWGGGWHTYNILQALSPMQRKRINLVIDKKETTRDIYHFGVKIVTPKQLIENDVDTIVISSYAHRREIGMDIYNLSSKYQIIDVYEWFELHDLHFGCEYYKNAIITYEDIFCHRKIYQEIKENKIKIIYLKKLIGDYIFIRDFVNAFSLIELLENQEDFEKYLTFKKELSVLFEIIKNRQNKRKDIIVNWIDALRADELKNMPFLSELAENSLKYENAYSVTSYTTATMKTLLSGKLLIDDKLYERKMESFQDDVLLNNLRENNYCFSYIGGHWVDNQLPNYSIHLWNLNKLYGKDIKLPGALLQWEMLAYLCNRIENCFIITHSLQETHQPYYSGTLNEMQPYTEKILAEIMSEDKKLHRYQKMIAQVHNGQKYLDKQFKWYSEFYGDTTTKIYMSDHGQYRGETPVCVDGRVHVVLFINGRQYSSYKFNGLFSYQNFHKMIAYILTDNLMENLDRLNSEYVYIQGDDVYSQASVQRFLSLKNTMSYESFFMQHRGIISKKEKYIHYATGKEFYFVNSDDKVNQIENIKFKEKIELLKKLAGNTFIDIYKEERYFPAQEVYEKLGFTRDSRIWADDK